MREAEPPAAFEMLSGTGGGQANGTVFRQLFVVAQAKPHGEHRASPKWFPVLQWPETGSARHPSSATGFGKRDPCSTRERVIDSVDLVVREPTPTMIRSISRLTPLISLTLFGVTLWFLHRALRELVLDLVEALPDRAVEPDTGVLRVTEQALDDAPARRRASRRRAAP